MQGERIEGLVFDMDGLLLDTEAIALRAWKKAALALGWEMTDEFYPQIMGCNEQECMVRLTQHTGDAAFVKRLMDSTMVHYESAVWEEAIPLRPGALEILRWGEGEGLRMVVATSTYKDLARHKLEKAGLDGFFESLTCGDEVARGKPAPDIYQLASERMKKGVNALVAMEDSPNGLRSATSAGIRTIMVPDLAPAGEVERELAWWVCRDLIEAKERIAAARNGGVEVSPLL